MEFCFEQMPRLRGTYYGRTGEVAREKPPGIEAWASLARIAVVLDEREALDEFYVYLVSNAARACHIPNDAWLYVTAELLLGLQAVAPS